jgi:hypothetical protein
MKTMGLQMMMKLGFLCLETQDKKLFEAASRDQRNWRNRAGGKMQSDTLVLFSSINDYFGASSKRITLYSLHIWTETLDVLHHLNSSTKTKSHGKRFCFLPSVAYITTPISSLDCSTSTCKTINE